MKIMSIRKGFTSDHSSTSYEFLAVDRPLKKEERQAVASLSRRANPTRRKVSFIYHVDGYDIPGGWKPLMRDYYDVMYSESYGWWILAFGLNMSLQQQKEIMKYEFDGVEDCGISIYTYGERVVVAIYCCLEREYIPDDCDYYSDEDDDFDEDSVSCDDYECEDGLHTLLTKVRRQLMEGDYRALYAVWEVYGYLEDEEDEEWESPPVPPEKSTGKSIIEQFRNMLTLLH